MGDDLSDGYYVVTIHNQRAYLKEGDWILPEPMEGRFYPCKPDVFAATYEPETSALRSSAAAGDLVSYLHRQWAWSKETFGPSRRTGGVVEHIRKELREIEADPHDLSEWVDVIILAMDGFWRHGGQPENLLPAMQAKQDKNFARSWPDWRTMGEDRAIEHDRSGETSPEPPAPKAEGEADATPRPVATDAEVKGLVDALVESCSSEPHHKFVEQIGRDRAAILSFIATLRAENAHLSAELDALRQDGAEVDADLRRAAKIVVDRWLEQVSLSDLDAHLIALRAALDARPASDLTKGGV